MKGPKQLAKEPTSGGLPSIAPPPPTVGGTALVFLTRFLLPFIVDPENRTRTKNPDVAGKKEEKKKIPLRLGTNGKVPALR